MKTLVSCLIFLTAVSSLATLPLSGEVTGEESLVPEVPELERFYDEKLERHVQRIAEQIVSFNVHHGHPQHQHQHQHQNQAPEVKGGHSEHHHHHHHHHQEEPEAIDAKKKTFEEDDEGMMSDQPAATTGSEPTSEQKLKRELDFQSAEDRDKQKMTNAIKDKVITLLRKSNASHNHFGADISFYANCDPAGTSEEAAVGAEDMLKLYFTLSHQLEESTVTAATLRLYRKLATNHSASSDQSTDVLPCGYAYQQPGEKYRITAYYYSKTGNKRHKLKRKILDATMMSDKAAYVTLDVLQGIRDHAKGKLFSASVQIEDQYGGAIKASDFFKGPSCTVNMQIEQSVPAADEETSTVARRTAHAADALCKSVRPVVEVRTTDALVRHNHHHHPHPHHLPLLQSELQQLPERPKAIIVARSEGGVYKGNIMMLQHMIDQLNSQYAKVEYNNVQPDT